ncbi:MAG: hypothetical protein HY882_09055 [Deltaproteobacteria bacterium]|nr:hypothetical protein [Deltaproteobacteria bacterium]
MALSLLRQSIVDEKKIIRPLEKEVRIFSARSIDKKLPERKGKNQERRDLPWDVL